MPKKLEPINLTETTELIIKQISLNASNPQIDLDQGLHKVRATLIMDLFDDKLAMRAIACRMAVLKNAAGHEQFNCDLTEACPELKACSCCIKIRYSQKSCKGQIIKVEMGSSSKKIKLSSEVSEPTTLPTETSTYTSKPATLLTEAATYNIPINDPSKNIKPRSVIIPKKKGNGYFYDIMTTPPPKTKDLSYRAAKLLRMGAMPLCPPASRQWAEDESLTLKEGNLTCKWPPRNWKRLSPDQKLLQLEILSVRIFQERGVSTTSIQRSDILDQFSKESTAHSKYFTYASLRKIANTKTTNSENLVAVHD